jgi:hypothetical protein
MSEPLEMRALLTADVSPVLELPGLTEMDDATSTLTREDDAVALTVNTVGLEPGTYQLDWVIFNNPEYCAGECLMDDFDNPDVQVSRLYAAEATVDQSGQANFFARLSENDTSDALWGPGMLDARTAEVHYLIQNQATEANVQGGIHYGVAPVDSGLVTVDWSKTLDPMDPGAVWRGTGQTADGEDVSVRVFDLQMGDDGVTIENLIFEVTVAGQQPASLRMSGEFTPGAESGTGSISLTGEQNSSLQSTTDNGLITTAGDISYTNALGEVETVSWEKTLDPLDPLAVWVGSGQTVAGEEVNIRASDLQVAEDGVTIESLLFEVTVDGHQTASMRMSGWFVPGSEAGTGSIRLTGEQGAILRSNTANGLVTTAGEIRFLEQYMLHDDIVTVNWSKTLDPLAPGGVWVGAGQTADGQDVSVRAYDLRMADDGVTIDSLIFEVTPEGGEPVSLRMSGVFMPGAEQGTGSISLSGEQASSLQSTTVNGLVTTAGDISYTGASGEVQTVSWEKTLDPLDPLAVWAGSGQTATGEEVMIRASDLQVADDGVTIEHLLFEVTVDGHQTASLRMSGQFTPGTEPGTGSIFLTGEQGSVLRSTTDNGLITTAGEISLLTEQVVYDAASQLWEGDANGDGQFDQFDVIQVQQSAKYLSGEPATWEEGDWNRDGVFDEEDIVSALQTGRYLQEPMAAETVEPLAGMPAAHDVDRVDGLFAQMGA